MQTQTVNVPDIGDFQGVDVVEVHVKPGDVVSVDFAVLTLESDKATLDVPSPVAGRVVEVFVKVGDKVSAGDPILTLTAAAAAAAAPDAEAPDAEAPDAEAPPPEPSPEPPLERSPEPPLERSPEPPLERSPEPVPEPVPTPESAVPHAGPGVRRLARELSVDLGGVKGTGRKGRIRADDVLGVVREGAGGRTAEPAGSGLPAVPAPDYASFGEVEEVPLSRVRRKGAAHLHASWLNIPHVTQHGEADVTELEAFRRSLKEETSQAGVRLTSMAFLMRACVSALMEYPDFNSSLSPEGDVLVRKRYYNLGIAVDTDDGLVVPVVHGVERKGVVALARELAELSERARNRGLKPGDVQGATFTISNLGALGGTAFTPIVNAPEVAILGVSRSAIKPVWDGEGFGPGGTETEWGEP